MEISEFSKICMICITLLSLPMASQQSPQSLLTYDTILTDDETISLAAAQSPSQSSYPESPSPEARGYLASSTDPDEYNPPPPPPQPYIDTFAPESQNNQLLSPDYSTSPSPVYLKDYPYAPSYIEVQAPESYYGYSPIQAPIPPLSSETGSSRFLDTNDLTSPPNLAPQPYWLPTIELRIRMVSLMS
ncbi:DNA-directed RNA polymerase II subunit RPB1-like [Pyrus x bretschneideri]|uniref:DNA-directed RNA polymerase II subunit RPB1-like n=1 Tax=Pyrus x bretschneideri TaxID=225117 RepID=UPI00202E2E10|nr:DNA-directed RNA polymerase II subunit RPB1-like [Pyrus x bretschneideri]